MQTQGFQINVHSLVAEKSNSAGSSQRNTGAFALRVWFGSQQDVYNEIWHFVFGDSQWNFMDSRKNSGAKL